MQTQSFLSHVISIILGYHHFSPFCIFYYSDKLVSFFILPVIWLEQPKSMTIANFPWPASIRADSMSTTIEINDVLLPSSSLGNDSSVMATHAWASHSSLFSSYYLLDIATSPSIQGLSIQFSSSLWTFLKVKVLKYISKVLPWDSVLV